MAPRSSRTANPSLTDEEIAALQAALAEGRNPTVYLREAIPSLEVPEGASARVYSIDGRSLVVKPRRIDDELPFEAEELRMTRTAPAPAPVKRKRSAAPQSRAAAEESVPAKKPAPAKSPAQAKSSVPRKAPAKKSAAAGEAAASAGRTPAANAPAPAKRAPAKAAKSARSKSAPTSVTITVEGTAGPDADNEWTVRIAGGGTRAVKPVPVGADAVVQAVSALGVAAATKAVDAVIVSARAQAQHRVEELARELAEAEKALRSLES